MNTTNTSFADSVGASDEAAATPAVKDGKEVKYFFKTTKVKDADGKVIGEGRKHPDVVAVLPMPSMESIHHFLNCYKQVGEDGKTPTLESKVAEMLVDQIHDLIVQAGRSQINDFLENNPEGTFSATNFDLAKMTLEYIATLDRGSRGAWAPSDEELAAFNEDYTNVFVYEVQYDPKKVKVHCDQYAKGFTKIKSDKIALGKMQEFLTVWASKTAAMDTHSQTYEWLAARLNKYLKAEEKNYADAL